MDTFTLPPATNWNLSNIMACNDNGLLAYGCRGEVSILEYQENGKSNVSFLSFAHRDKVNVVVFSPRPISGKFSNCLATCGDDGMVRVWDFREQRLLVCHSGHKDGIRVTGLDWSRADTNRVVSINDLGVIVPWDLASNTIRRLHCGVKMLPHCLACCPHDKDIIAVGCKGGVVLVIDIKGEGKIIHRLRGNEQDVISVSWCPVPYNVIKHKKNENTNSADGGEHKETGKEKERELLLATSGLDRAIFIWRTGSDGRFEVVLNLPNNSLSSNVQRRKGVGSNFLWISVLWVDAYTLLSTSQFAELLAWDLNSISHNVKGGRKPQPRLIHSRHNKRCFSIACPISYETAPEGKDARIVWTTAMDKHLIATSLASGSVTYDIPTIGGVVFCMAVSPLDPNRLAIGSGDSKLFVWNTSDLFSLDLNTYWKKIIGKVMALSWHPSEEDVIAYGTSDGHVGILDLGSNKPPTLLRLHLRRTVYRVCWALPLLKPENTTSDSKLALFAVGDGDILQFNANSQEPEEEPKSLNAAFLNSFDQSLGLKKTLTHSDISFKPDHTCFAVSSDNGSVYIVSCDSLMLKHTLYPHKKLINNLEWHPTTVACDNNISPYQHWLATSADNIKVFNLPPEGQPELVASLNGHSEKVVSLAWSPHFHGRLLSASYDCTVQIWDVSKETCLAVCLEHNAPVMCAVFSPQDPDVVISGSNDTTVRFWAISKMSASSTKLEKKEVRLSNALKMRSEAEEATELTVDDHVITKNIHKRSRISPNVSVQSNNSIQSSNSEIDFEDVKKPEKIRKTFPTTSSQLAQAQHFEVLMSRLVDDLPENANPPSAADIGYLDFFGDDKAMHRLLLVEESLYIQKKQVSLAQQSALWRGDTTQMIREAITKKQLTDWLVSMAPLAGFELWEEACEKYAVQLAEIGEVTKASSYLLAVHKTQEAVQMLVDHKRYREAVAIAKCRLTPDDPLINKAYTEWAYEARGLGQSTLSAHCFLAAGNLQACVEVLARIKELRWLRVASQLARHAGQTEQADSLTLECLTLSISAGKFTFAYQLLAETPQYKYWSVWIRASELLAKIKNRSEKELFAWLEQQQTGLFNLCDELSTTCTSVAPVYHQLLAHVPSNNTPQFERDMWNYVSGQLAVACAARLEESPALFLRHVVSAVSAAFHYQTVKPTSLALPLTLSLLAPNGLSAEGSILKTECQTSEEKQLLKSLRAFACASLIHWMNNNWEKVTNLGINSETIPSENHNGDGDKDSEKIKMVWPLEMLELCSADVLDGENVAFFVKKAQLQQLQDVVARENIQKKCNEQKVEGINNKNKSKDNDKTVIVKTDSIKKSFIESEVTSECQDPSELKPVDDNLNVAKETQITGESNSEELKKETEASKIKTTVESNSEKMKDKTEPSKTINFNNTNGISVELSATSNGCVKDEKNTNANNVDLKEHSDNARGINTNTTLSNGEDNTQSSKCDTASAASDSIPNDTETSQNGSTTEKVSEEDSNSKLKEIEDLSEFLQKFEADRICVPNPFTAYINIKYLLDNLVMKQDAKLAHDLQENCDKLWKMSQK